jgi:hypothetical protein
MPYASLDDIEAICDLVIQCALPLDQTLLRLAEGGASPLPQSASG